MLKGFDDTHRAQGVVIIYFLSGSPFAFKSVSEKTDPSSMRHCLIFDLLIYTGNAISILISHTVECDIYYAPPDYAR